jgi:hypothetical protein
MATYKGIQGYTVQKLSSDPTASEVEGQLWYNSSSGKFKIAVAAAGAWASGGDLTTAGSQIAGIGTATAALAAGRSPYPSSGSLSETYDGTTWTEGNDLNTGRRNARGTGTSTAGMVVGGWGAAAVTATETYDGTSWTETGNALARAGGTQSQGVAGASATSAMVFGGEPQTPTYGKYSETYNGSTWTEGNNLNTQRSAASGAGIVTAALCIAGYSIPGVITNVESYDGTSWSETSTDVNSARGEAGSSGTSTLCLFYSGTPGDVTLTESFDGSTWTEVGDLATGRGQMGNAQAPTNTNTSALCIGGYAAPNELAITEAWSDPVYTIKTVTVS